MAYETDLLHGSLNLLPHAPLQHAPSPPSALEYCLDVEKLNLSAIRTVRVLRPLRAINRIPSK